MFDGDPLTGRLFDENTFYTFDDRVQHRCLLRCRSGLGIALAEAACLSDPGKLRAARLTTSNSKIFDRQPPSLFELRPSPRLRPYRSAGQEHAKACPERSRGNTKNSGGRKTVFWGLQRNLRFGMAPFRCTTGSGFELMNPSRFLALLTPILMPHWI